MRAFIVIGLGYGDEGKGAITDYLTREHNADTVVRFNGGAQAAHTVVDGGRIHTFAQFGSGTLAGAKTHLSRFMLVNPYNLLPEAEHLRQLGITDPLSTLTIDENAVITTPFHVAANRLRELARGSDRHGSCGLGIGETVRDLHDLTVNPILASDLGAKNLKERLQWIQRHKLQQLESESTFIPDTPAARREWHVLTESSLPTWTEEVYRLFSKLVVSDFEYGETVIFEGAQGVLLDEWYGFHPYTTWSTTTFQNALKLMPDDADVIKFGVLRAFATRHGPGPFVTESVAHQDWLGVSFDDPNNAPNPWQGDLRTGYTDLVATRYAVDVTGGIDFLAITHMDTIMKRKRWKVCQAYLDGEGLPYFCLAKNPEHDLTYQEQLTNRLLKSEPQYLECAPDDVPGYYEVVTGTPVGILSYSPTADFKEDLTLSKA